MKQSGWVIIFSALILSACGDKSEQASMPAAPVPVAGNAPVAAPPVSIPGQEQAPASMKSGAMPTQPVAVAPAPVASSSPPVPKVAQPVMVPPPPSAVPVAVPPPVEAVCNSCGTVSDVKTVKIEGEGSGVGAVAGGLLGGLIGNQIGGGTGKDLATIGVAAGGAYVGHQVEKQVKSETQYRVIVKMDNGSSKTFKYSDPVSFQAGDRVRVRNGKLTRI